MVESCVEGGCSVVGTSFIDDFDDTSCIDVSTILDVSLSGGSIIPSGVTAGELESEPTMEGLYHFNNDPIYLEDDIRLVNDFSEKGRNAWAYNDGLFYSASGKFGGAHDVRRAGAPKSLLISNRDIDDSYTFAFWMRLSDDTSNVIGASRLFGNDVSLIFSYSSNVLRLRFPDSHSLITPNLGWIKDSWHHIAVSLKPGNNTIYVDGNNFGSYGYSGGFNYPANFYMGWWSGSFPSVDISIDEFAIWNRNLEIDEIKALARGEMIRTGELESNWIDSGNFNSIKATLSGAETTSIFFTCDGTNWEELENGKWESYKHHPQLPCSSFKYKLKFSGGDANINADSITFDWRTEAESTSFTFAVYGDSHEYNGKTGIIHEEIVNQIEKIDPDFVLHHGDFSDGNLVQWRATLRNIQSLLTRITNGLGATYFASVGNHEKWSIDGNQALDGYFDVFNYSPHRTLSPVDPSFSYMYHVVGLPLNDPDDPNYYNNPYYSFKYKNSCFISLYMYDVDHTAEYHGTVPLTGNFQPIPNLTDFSGATPQYKWLYNTLKDCSEDTNIDWKFVYFHFPTFSSGVFNSNPDTESYHTQKLRQNWVPLFEYFNVSIVFAGHEHDYERTYPIKQWYNATKDFNEGIVDSTGVVYITSGGGGGHLSPGSLNPKDYTAYGFDDKYHMTVYTVDGNTLYGSAVLIDGTIVDTFVI